MKNYIFEISSLQKEESIGFIETILNEADTGLFYFSDCIKEEIGFLREIGESSAAARVQNIIAYLAGKNKLKYFDAESFLNLNVFSGILELPSKFILITEKESIFRTLNELSEKGLSICSIDGGRLKEWRKQKSGAAFYVENDKYINNVDTDNINIDYVYSPVYGYLKLDKSFVIAGGEGTCYRTYNGLLVKIYKSKHITYTNYKKLQTMLKYDIGNPYIIWPRDIVYYEGNFVGYAMDELKCIVSIDELRDYGFKGFSPLDKLKLCRDFLKLIEYLHKKKILVGDMKFDNIVVDNNKKVYLIDTGSFQIEDYACLVYNREFSDKEYHADDLKKNLRVVEDEYFPINKIIFEILMNKNPYYSDGDIEIDANKNNHFHFALRPMVGFEKGLPYHLLMWYNLSQRMRDYFYYYFTDRKITLISDWIIEIDRFINEKQKGA